MVGSDPTTLTPAWGSGTNQPGNGIALPFGAPAGDFDPANPFPFANATLPGAANPMVSGTLTLGPDTYDIITAFLNRNGEVWSTAADANIHDTIQVQGKVLGSAGGGVTYSGTSSASGAARSLLGSIATSVNISIIAAMKRAATGTAATGSGSVTITGAATATSTAAATGAGSVTVTGSAATQIISALATTNPLYVAHRGGYTSTYGEQTLPNYTASASQNSQAFLEISVWDTADAGVYAASHDRTTARVFSGASLDVPSSTWATLSSLTTIIGGNPIQRLD